MLKIRKLNSKSLSAGQTISENFVIPEDGGLHTLFLKLEVTIANSDTADHTQSHISFLRNSYLTLEDKEGKMYVDHINLWDLLLLATLRTKNSWIEYNFTTTTHTISASGTASYTYIIPVHFIDSRFKRPLDFVNGLRFSLNDYQFNLISDNDLDNSNLSISSATITFYAKYFDDLYQIGVPFSIDYFQVSSAREELPARRYAYLLASGDILDDSFTSTPVQFTLKKENDIIIDHFSTEDMPGGRGFPNLNITLNEDFHQRFDYVISNQGSVFFLLPAFGSSILSVDKSSYVLESSQEPSASYNLLYVSFDKVNIAKYDLDNLPLNDLLRPATPKPAPVFVQDLIPYKLVSKRKASSQGIDVLVYRNMQRKIG